MKKQVQAVENDIKGFKPSADNDKFKEVMKISFYDSVILLELTQGVGIIICLY